ncbi:formimidoyltransferase-cyclodeaminase [Amborella trichopoda]|uniref:glutamate formimidoyltransferase n=1 Tax=Amborella trichopoda TaxID=13333 RepID=W1P8X9_AMBTC|nr:formimidoyltransferase-cyclodeaminase [Amborella trichopoda]ERN03445.1 hypothetical protein AMTR_s00003p00265230 [Amborella trichopoda]|eukprot:XP_006841770.1 formimidoyltransferase-cyclodeaminase [Amborella trichopoda]
MMRQSLLACCKLYISESRNASALDSIERAAKPFHPQAAIVNKFQDLPYNRVGYTLVGQISALGALHRAALAMVEAAFRVINLESHTGSHPRLGVVDHICFHPLAEASLEDATRLARSAANELGNKLQVPTYLYGAAHQGARTLDSIRRELGYFHPNFPQDPNHWTGPLISMASLPEPDAGPKFASQAKGVVIVGASPWVANYNVPIFTENIKICRKIARRVSGRGGGLAGVQAMALAHGEGIMEIACNLLETSVGAEEVQRRVESLGGEEGLVVKKGYFTDFDEEKAVEKYWQLLH